jgi:hypothetical protein
MEKKPLPIIILAILHLIEPLTKSVFIMLFYGFSGLTSALTEYYTSGSYVYLFEYFLLFPIAGFAIYKVKNWSIPVFLIAEIWVFMANIQNFKLFYESAQYLQLGFWIAFALLNVIVVLYFLLPAVRLAYFNPNIRWWESKPRYKKTIKCLIDGNEALIKNISITGIFVVAKETLKEGEQVSIEFSDSNTDIKVAANIVHNFKMDGEAGSGVQFNKLSGNVRSKLKTLLKKYEAEGLPRRPERSSFSEDFNAWVKSFSKNGTGLVPDIDKKHKS